LQNAQLVNISGLDFLFSCHKTFSSNGIPSGNKVDEKDEYRAGLDELGQEAGQLLTPAQALRYSLTQQDPRGHLGKILWSMLSGPRK
jgi:hypothetical protein